jgi:hypothetical protein
MGALCHNGGIVERGEKQKLSRRVPAEKAATPAEVEEAIDSLTEADLLRLEGYAIWRIRGMGRKALGRNHEDLLSEAIHATLEGRRSWNKNNVDFMRYLLGAMQSISDNWSKRFNNIEPILESDILGITNDSDIKKGLADIHTIPPYQDNEIAVKQQEEIIRRYFEDDPLVTIIICELKEGLKLRDIKEKYNIKENDYEAAIKRMRRKLTRLYEGEKYV